MHALANETSPYLLQHADNPVAWYPWGPEALERARSENKSILLSVGCSACHWCHVMAHESSGDETTAAFMNAHFVNIKVDREERPDLGSARVAARVGIARDSVILAPIPSPKARGPIPRPSWLSSSFRPLSWGCVASVPSSIYHPGKPLRVLVHQRSKLERRWLEENLCAVIPIGRIESIEPLRGEAVPDMAVALAGATQILVPRAGAPGSSSRTATPNLINAYDHPAALRQHPDLEAVAETHHTPVRGKEANIMATVTFDILKFANKLKAAGVPPEQAEAEAAVLSEVLEVNLKELATKEDLRSGLGQLEMKLDMRFEKVLGEIVLLKWLLGILIAGVVSLIIKSFF